MRNSDSGMTIHIFLGRHEIGAFRCSSFPSQLSSTKLPVNTTPWMIGKGLEGKTSILDPDPIRAWFGKEKAWLFGPSRDLLSSAVLQFAVCSLQVPHLSVSPLLHHILTSLLTCLHINNTGTPHYESMYILCSSIETKGRT